jgi:hypothetical protein
MGAIDQTEEEEPAEPVASYLPHGRKTMMERDAFFLVLHLMPTDKRIEIALSELSLPSTQPEEKRRTSSYLSQKEETRQILRCSKMIQRGASRNHSKR